MFESAQLETLAPEDVVLDDPWPDSLGRPLTDERGMLDVRRTLDRLAAEQPGPAMLSVLSLFTAMEDGLSPDERVDLVVLLERCEAWVVAQKQAALAGCARDAGPGDAKRRTSRFEDTRLELSLALNWSESMVWDRLSVADELCNRLPGTWEQLADGRLDFRRAREIALGSQKLSDSAKAAAFEAAVLPKASDQTAADVRRSVARALMGVDPEGAESRRKGVRHDRCITRSPLEDGAARLSVNGPAEEIAVMHRALTEGARQLKETGQVDNLDQGRFDTLLDWAVRHLDEQVMPTRGALPVAATIIAKASTLAGADDDPAEVAGFGPITAQTARDLLAGRAPAPGPFDKWGNGFARETYSRDEDTLPPEQRRPDVEPFPESDDELPPDDWEWQPPPQPDRPVTTPNPFDPFSVAWRVLKVDPVTGWAVPPPGVRMNYGTDRRFASPAQARYVRDRDRTCEVPTCPQWGTAVEIDHRVEAARGGPTDVASLGTGCKHHNRTTRNCGDWQIEPHGDGTATLITPQGRRYPIKPHNYLD